jgi:hypothetical protein
MLNKETINNWYNLVKKCLYWDIHSNNIHINKKKQKGGGRNMGRKVKRKEKDDFI